jgi:integrase
MRGVPLKAVQELLGHATVEMTMRYAHLSPNVPRDAVNLLDLPAPPERRGQTVDKTGDSLVTC